MLQTPLILYSSFTFSAIPFCQSSFMTARSACGTPGSLRLLFISSAPPTMYSLAGTELLRNAELGRGRALDRDG
jgi:hypothetical protein